MIKTKPCDIMVIGLGAMGSAALYQLSQKTRNKKIIGLDQFSPPHSMGSSHGESRITRQAIGEGEIYTPLSLRSYNIWRQLERDTGENCLNITGGLVIASGSDYGLHGKKDFLGETIRTAVKYDIKHERLNARETMANFPQFMLTGEEEAYFEYEAGILRPENCINAQLKMAMKSACVNIKTGEKVLAIKPGGDKVTVFTGSNIYEAGQVILTVGPWIKNLLAKKYHELFRVYRQTMHWFHPKESIVPYKVGNFPVFIWQFDTGFFYGFPAIGGRDGGVKVASEQMNVQTDPEMVNRNIYDEETKTMFDTYVVNRLPGLSSNCAKATACLYTVTPDSNFIIDFHPEFPNVIIASPCSGHGFKHSAAIGEILAQMAIEGKSIPDISPFSIKRFIA